MRTSYSPWRSSTQQQQRHTLKQLQHWYNRCPSSRTGLLLKCNSSKLQDLYVVLGVPYDADAPAIRAAFRAKAKLLHPDGEQRLGVPPHKLPCVVLTMFIFSLIQAMMSQLNYLTQLFHCSQQGSRCRSSIQAAQQSA